MDDSERKSDRRSKSKSRSHRSPARYYDAQDEGEEYAKTARRKKTKGTKVGISESPSHSKGAESSRRRRKGSDSTQDAAESSSLPKELNYEYFEQLDSNLRRAGELLEEHGRGIVWQAADVITCIPEYCPPRCYMTKLCRCNTCCERCCLDTEHRLTGFHSNAKDEGTDVPDEEELTLSGSSDTSVASLLGDLSSDEGTSKASARLATAARDAKRAVRLAKQFRAAARTIDSLECSNESEHQMRALYTKELMDKAVFYAKKANEALAGYAALRRALRGIADATSGDDISRFDALQDAQRRPPYDPSLESTYLQGEQAPYGPPSYSARGYGSAPEFAARYPQQPGAQMPLRQAVPAAVGQGYRFGGARGVPGPLDAQRLRWASAPVVGYPPSLQTTLSLSRMAEMVVNKAQQASEEASRFQRVSDEALAEAKILEGVSDDRLPPLELKEYRKVSDVRPRGVVGFDELASECAIDRGPHVPKGIARVRMFEATGTDGERQPGQLSEQGLTKSKSFDNDLTMRKSNTEKRPARKGGSSNLEADLTGKGGPRTPVPSTMPPMKQRATRRASVSAALESQMQNRTAIDQSQEKPARPSGRRASVSSLQQELSDTVQPPPSRKMKSLAARRASVGAGLLLKLGAHMKDSSESSTPEGEHSVPAAAPDSASFQARATRRASVSSRGPLSQSLNEDPDAFRAKATRRASVSSKGLSTPLDRTTADPDSFKARASRRASVSSKALSPPDESMRNEQDHTRAKALRRGSVASRDFSADHSKEHETFKARAARRASVSAKRIAIPIEGDDGSFKAKAARRASVSSRTISPDIYSPSEAKNAFKAKAARRASVSARLTRSPPEVSEPFKSKATRRASVSAKSPEGPKEMSESFKSKTLRGSGASAMSPEARFDESESFKAKAARRANVSAKSPEDRKEMSESLSAKAARESGGSAMSPEGPQDVSESFKTKTPRKGTGSAMSPEPLDETSEPFKSKASRKATASVRSPDGPQEISESFKAKAVRRASVSAKVSEGLRDSQHESFGAKAARRASVSAKGFARHEGVQKPREAEFRRPSVSSIGRTSPTVTPKSESRAHKAKGTKVTVVEPDVPEASAPAAKKPRRRASVCAAKYKRLYGDVSAEENTKSIGGDKGETESDEPIEPRKQARRPSINATKMSSDAVKAGPEKPESHSVGHDKGASSEDKEHNTQPPAALSQDKTLLSLIRESLEPNTARTGAEETKDAKGGRIVVKIKPAPIHMSSKKVGTRRAAKDKDFFTEICDERLLNNCGSHPTDPREIQKIIDEGVGKPKYTKDMDRVQEIPSRIPEIIYELSEQSLDMEVIPSERCKETQISLPFDGASFREHHRSHTTASISTAYRTTGGATSASMYQELKSTSPGKQAQPDSTESGSRAHLKVLPSDTYVFVAATAAIAGGDAKNPKATTAAGKDSKKGGKETAAAENTRKSSNHPEERPKHESDSRRSSRHSKESLKQKTGSEIPSRPSSESLKREKGIESTRRESGAEKHSRHSKESMHGETGAGKHSRRSNESVRGEGVTGQPSKPSNESLRRETHAENKRSSSLKPAQGSSDSVNESSKREKIPPTRTENDDKVRDEQRSVRDSVGKVGNRADKVPNEGKRKVSRDAWAADPDDKGAEAPASKGEDGGGSKNVKSSSEDAKWHEGSAKQGEHGPVEVIDKRRGSGSKREARQNRGSVSQKEPEEIDDKTRGKRAKNTDDDTAQQPTTDDGGHSKYSDRRGEKRHSDGYLKDANKKTEEKKQPTKVAESTDVTKAASQAQEEDKRAPMESRIDKQSNAPMGYLSNPGVPSSWFSTDVEEGRAVYTTGKLTEDAEALRKIQATNIAKALMNFDADEQEEIPIPDGVPNSELPRNILRTNDKYEVVATARNDADFTEGRYQRVPTGAEYIPEDENREARPDGADRFYSDQQLAFPVRQNTIGSSSSGTDAPSNEPNKARVLCQKSAELVLPKKLAFGGDDWTIVSPLDMYADHSEVSRPDGSEDMTVGDAAEVEPRSRLFNPAKTRELRDDIADADLPEPEGNATWSQQLEGEQWEGALAEGEQPEEPPEVELPEELPEEELPQDDLQEQEYLDEEAPENQNDVAVEIPEPENNRVQQALDDRQDHGMQEVIELQNVDYELQSRPHAPLRGPDIRDFNFWDLDGPAALYPESRLVLALAFVAGMWILYLLFTTKAATNRKPFLELFTAPATEHEIRRDHIETEPFGVNDLKTKGVVAATEIESVVSARPRFLYFCDTPYCKESALHLASMLGEEPCLNFYRYVCGKMTRKWNPMVGSALSTDAFMVNEAAKLTSDYILNQEHRGMKPARNLLEACLDHEHDEQWSRTELSELFFEYFGSSWPAESNPVTMEAVWVIAGRLARDLKLEALARVSVNVHPEDNLANVPAIDEPVLLYRRADFEELEYMDMLKTAIEQALALLSPDTNSAPHISSIKTTMEQLADMVSTDPAGSVGTRKHQLTKVRVLATGVRTLLRTVLPDSVTVPGNADILVKSPRYFENLQGSKGSSLDPQAVFDYLGFRVMVHFAAFSPQPSVQHLRALEAGYLLPEDASAQDFCTREVERVFPAIFTRAFALRTNLSNWLSAWSSELNRTATRIQALKADPVTAQNDADITRQVFNSLKIEAAAPQWILNDSSFERYAQGLERQLSVALNLDPSNSLKRLCFFAKMLRQDEMEQALQGTSDNQSAVSLFGTEAKYEALSNTIYMPLVTVNWSLPADSITFAVHAARYAVRVSKALVPMLRQDNAHSSEQLSSSDRHYQQQLNATTKCMVEQYENASRNLKSAFLQVTDHTPLGPALLDQTVALMHAYSVFKEKLRARRFEKSNFRLSGLPRLTPEQLFFVAYGHDNCEASNTIHQRRRWFERGELPPEDRVNFPLIQFEEFARVFTCNSTAPMVANRHCPMAHTATTYD